jgi:hypothetical protein
MGEISEVLSCAVPVGDTLLAFPAGVLLLTG